MGRSTSCRCAVANLWTYPRLYAAFQGGNDGVYPCALGGERLPETDTKEKGITVENDDEPAHPDLAPL